MKWIGLIAVVLTGALLLSAVGDFPDFGDPDSPANGGVGDFSVSQHYLTHTEADTKVPNVVTAVLADYRGYDTMFETTVIFIAGIGIIAILRSHPPGTRRGPAHPIDATVDGDHQRIIIGITCRIMIPIIQIFALYVVAHGHHSPGGGFQGGVMLGASFILMGLSRDLQAALSRFSEKRFILLACVGIVIYAGFGLLCLLLERNFLDYGVLDGFFHTDPVMARSHGIFAVEVGVAFTVTAIMFAIYANLSSKGRLDEGL